VSPLSSTEANELFIRIKEAYEVLSDDHKKHLYDKSIRNTHSTSYASFYNSSAPHRSSKRSATRSEKVKDDTVGDNIPFNFKEHFEQHYGQEFEKLKKNVENETNDWRTLRPHPATQRTIATLVIMGGFVGVWMERL
jgi:DnaJ-class molecular chaperone